MEASGAGGDPIVQNPPGLVGKYPPWLAGGSGMEASVAGGDPRVDTQRDPIADYCDGGFWLVISLRLRERRLREWILTGGQRTRRSGRPRGAVAS